MTGLAILRRASNLAVAALALAAGLLLPTLAVAQAYPSRAVKIIVPFPAGGPLDSTAALLDEVRRLYDGRLVTAHDLDVF